MMVCEFRAGRGRGERGSGEDYIGEKRAEIFERCFGDFLGKFAKLSNGCLSILFGLGI